MALAKLKNKDGVDVFDEWFGEDDKIKEKSGRSLRFAPKRVNNVPKQVKTDPEETRIEPPQTQPEVPDPCRSNRPSVMPCDDNPSLPMGLQFPPSSTELAGMEGEMLAEREMNKKRGRIPKTLLDPLIFDSKDDQARARTLNKYDPHKAARYMKIITLCRDDVDDLRICGPPSYVTFQGVKGEPQYLKRIESFGITDEWKLAFY